MAKEVDLAGMDQSISFDSVSGFLTSSGMALLAILMSLGIGGLALYLYNNYVVPNTPEQVGAIDVMTEP